MYEVVVKSKEICIPLICPCCLRPVTDQKEKMSFGAQISDEGWRTQNIQLTFPYCRNCISHVHWFDRGAMAGFVRRAILSGIFLLPFGALVCAGVAESILSYLGISDAQSVVASCLGILLASLVMAYYLRAKLKADRPASLAGHAANERAVRIRHNMMSNLAISFDNKEYAKIFWEANRDNADPWPRSLSDEGVWVE